MPNKFTNVPSSMLSSMPVVQHAPRAPFIAKGPISTLTPKEKEARRILRLIRASADYSYGGGSGNTSLASAGQFFSPQLSTDFLELPQSIREKREIYRHFYNTDPIVGQSIDLHTELPLSKVRLGTPKPTTHPKGFKDTHDYANYILWFFTDMCNRTKLFQRLVTLVHHYWLDGGCVTGDTLISTPNGERRADSIHVGDKLLSHTGIWRTVEAVQRRAGTKILSLDIARLPSLLHLTEEHPVEVLVGDKFKFIPTQEIQVGDFVKVTWPTEIQDVSSVDLLAGTDPELIYKEVEGYTVHRIQKHARNQDAARVRKGLLTWLGNLRHPVRRSRQSIADEFGVNLSTLHNVILTLDQELPCPYRERISGGPKYGDHTLWLPIKLAELDSDWYYNIERDFYFKSLTNLPIDEDFLYLLGYWLGDGTLTRDSSLPDSWGRGAWSICFGKGSEEQKIKIKDILCRFFGEDVIYEHVDDETVSSLVLTHNPAFIEWWGGQFGCTSKGPNPKRVPSWIVALPPDKQQYLLAGLIDSDGCVCMKATPCVQVVSCSSLLIHSFRDIFLRLGVIPSLRIDSNLKDSFIDSQRVYSEGPFYVLSIIDKEGCAKASAKAIKGKKIDLNANWTKSHNSYKKVNSDIGFLVRDVAPHPDEDVFNFQVAEDHTFRANFISTHNCFIYAEDSAVDVPSDLGYEKKEVVQSVVTENGEAQEEPEVNLVKRDDYDEQELEYYKKHYKGWDRLILLPTDQVKITTYSFTDKLRIELIPSERDRNLISQAKSGDPIAEEMVQEIPEEVRDHLETGKLIPLGTDPDEGSFCFYLAGRRGAGEDLGQSILDRCHLPETLVITKRGDNIVQIPIEDLDPVTDLVLSKEGFFREFEVGARLISEPISLLHVAKIDPPIGCTRDHKYPVLRGAEVLDITAGEIKPGDYLQVAQIPISEAIKDVDLAEFMDGQEGSYTAKRSGNEVSLRLAVTNKTDNSFTVTYEKDQTSPRQINRSNNLNAVLEWADTLNEPVSMQSAEICEKFDLHPAEFKDMRRQLAQLGYNVTVTKSKHIVFPKNVKNLRADTSANYTKEFPRYLKLDGDFGYFLGYWLGDGHISKRHDIDYGVLGFTYGPNEILSVASIENKIKPILNLYKATWSETLAGAGIHLSSCQDALIRWIGQNFGHTCEDKHLPYWIFDTSKEFLFGVLRGFVDSDGDVTCNKKGSTTVRLSNTNAVLIDQLFLICTSLGIPASKPKPTKERWVKQANGQVSWAKPSYSIYFTQGPVVRRFFESGFLAKRKEPDSWKDGRSGSLHVFFEDKLYYRVEEVGSAHHDGLVYSLNVHEDHSFYSCNVAARNCLRVLFFRDKLRQAQTQIASRAMTPKRIVWADRISEMDVMDLREQVDLALVDPDYSIVTNYEVHWEEMGARDRLLDLSSEYEITDKQLHAGLGVTESLLSGETLYAGDRLKLEVINTRYMFLREMLQDYVENNLFKPVARRKGFVEKNEWGEEVVLYPRLSFTRLPLRDSQDTYDALFNLYQKGSIDVSLILEMFNIDPEDTKVRLQKDLFTVNDAIFNEVMRGIYSAISQKIVDETDVADRIIKELNLKIVPKAEEPAEGRY